MYVTKSAWRGRYLPFGQGEMTVAPVRLGRGGRVLPARVPCGLGDAFSQPANPTCTDWSSYLDPFCWALNLSTGGAGINTSSSSAYAGLPQPPAPLPPPAPAPTANNPNPLVLPPSNAAGATQTIDATLQAGASDNAQMYQDFFSLIPGQCPMSFFPAFGICDSWVYMAGLALGVAGFAYLAGGRRR